MLFYTDRFGTFYLGAVRHCGSISSFNYAELERDGYGVTWNSAKNSGYRLVCPD